MSLLALSKVVAAIEAAVIVVNKIINVIVVEAVYRIYSNERPGLILGSKKGVLI